MNSSGSLPTGSPIRDTAVFDPADKLARCRQAIESRFYPGRHHPALGRSPQGESDPGGGARRRDVVERHVQRQRCRYFRDAGRHIKAGSPGP